MGKIRKMVALAVILPLVIFMWPSFLGGKTDFFIVAGQSMLPTILPGSFLIVQKEPLYEIDDVVAFHYRHEGANQIVVHRIIDYDEVEKNFQMQGDNNQKPDAGRHTDEDIIGEVKFVIPAVGEALALMRNPAILVMLVGISAFWQMKQDKIKKRKERLRKLRLGELSPQKNKFGTVPENRPKKPNYTLFFSAIAMNVVIFLGTQISIVSGVEPKGDMMTGFLFKLFEPSTASTIMFSAYFVAIIGIYFFAKRNEIKRTIFQQRALKLGLVVKHRSSKAIIGAQIFWTLFLLVGFFHIITIWGDFLPLPL